MRLTSRTLLAATALSAVAFLGMTAPAAAAAEHASAPNSAVLGSEQTSAAVAGSGTKFYHRLQCENAGREAVQNAPEMV